MSGGTVAGGGEIDLAGLRFRERDQLRHGACGYLRIHDKNIGRRADQANRREVRLRVKIDLLVERRIGGEDAVIAVEQRVAVGWRARDLLGRDVAAGSGTVLDHERLAQKLLELL